MIVQFGGQTPLKLAMALHQMKAPIIGTSPTRSTWPRTASALAPFWTACASLAHGRYRPHP